MESERIRFELAALLPRYGISPDEIHLHDSAQGMDNLNIVFSTGGAKYFLRCYRITPAEEIEFELNLVVALVGRGFPTARAYRTKTGDLLTSFQGLPCALFEFVEGTPIGEHAPDSGIRVAHLIARLHKETRAMDELFTIERSRSDLGRLRALERMCEEDQSFRAKRGMSRFRGTARVLVQEFQAKARQAGNRLIWGIIHHDVNSGNILVDDSNHVRALVDFDEAHSGFLIFDLASLIHYWGMSDTGLVNVHKSCEMIRAYHSVRGLTGAEVALLPDAILIFFASDAAEYLMRHFEESPESTRVADCRSLATLYRLRESQEWRTALSASVIGG